MTFDLSGKRFLAFGRAGMDLMPDPPGTRIEDGLRFVADLGGSAANICAALTRAGCCADLFSAVSDDAVGRYIRNRLAHYDIGTAHVATTGGEARASLALSESRLDGHQTVIYRNQAADFEVSTDAVKRIDWSCFDALITTGTAFALNPSRRAGFAALDAARSARTTTVCDIDYRPYSWVSPEDAADTLTRVCDASDIVIGNDVEFDFVAGGQGLGLDYARSLTDKTVVYKMGEKGAISFADGQEFQTGIFRVDALKPTGAGDAFMGSFLAALAEGQSLRNAVTRGSAAAAYVVARVGCAPAMPTTAELDQFISTHPGMTEA